MQTIWSPLKRKSWTPSNRLAPGRLAAGALALALAAGCSSAPGESEASSSDESLASCSFGVTQNAYSGADYWGTITIKNKASIGVTGFSVEFTIPSGHHCTNDSVPAGATLGPLTGSGSSAYTQSNVCKFTWSKTKLAAGASLTFNYSTDATNFTSAIGVTVSSASCSTGGGGSSGGGSTSSGGGSGSSSGSSSGSGSGSSSGSGTGPVGTGWVQWSPTSALELEVGDVIHMYAGTSTDLLNNGAKYTDEGGIESFQMLNTTSNRVERRMWNDYTTGRWQFEGEVQAFPPTDNECVMQIFGGTQSGATTQMIRAYAASNGSLRIGSNVIATNIWGKWVKINVIHDTFANTVQTYVDGALKNTKSGDAPGPWYHKYGDYGTVTTGSAKVEWRNVAHYKK